LIHFYKRNKMRSKNEEKEALTLSNWTVNLDLTGSKLYLCGDIKIEEDIHPWKSGKILSRIDSNTLVTRSRNYILHGKMKVDSELMGTPPLFIKHKFVDGFPQNWDYLLEHWIKFEVTQKEIKEKWAKIGQEGQEEEVEVSTQDDIADNLTSSTNRRQKRREARSMFSTPTRGRSKNNLSMSGFIDMDNTILSPVQR